MSLILFRVVTYFAYCATWVYDLVEREINLFKLMFCLYNVLPYREVSKLKKKSKPGRLRVKKAARLRKGSENT